MSRDLAIRRASSRQIPAAEGTHFVCDVLDAALGQGRCSEAVGEDGAWCVTVATLTRIGIILLAPLVGSMTYTLLLVARLV
jgi:hypothetical protein